MNCSLDDLSWVLVEAVEWNSSDGTSNSWRDSLASITNEISDWEQFLALSFIGLINLELPSVWQSEVQLGMVGGLNLNKISHEVWSKKHWDSLNLVFNLWCSSWKSNQSEFFIRSKHYEFGSENNSLGVTFIVEELDCWVVSSFKNDCLILLFSFRDTLISIFHLTFAILSSWNIVNTRSI